MVGGKKRKVDEEESMGGVSEKDVEKRKRGNGQEDERRKRGTFEQAVKTLQKKTFH